LKSKFEQEKKDQVLQMMKLKNTMLPIKLRFSVIPDQFFVQPLDHFDPQNQVFISIAFTYLVDLMLCYFFLLFLIVRMFDAC